MESASKKAFVRKSLKDYSLAFKLSVVDQVEKGLLTYKQAQSRYGIQGRSTVLVWLRKLGQLYFFNPYVLYFKALKVYRFLIVSYK